MKYFYVYNNVEVRSDSLKELVSRLMQNQTYTEIRVYENSCKDSLDYIVKKSPNGAIIFRDIKVYNEYRRTEESS